MTTINEAVTAFLVNLSGNTQRAYAQDFMNEATGFLMVMESYKIRRDMPLNTLTERHGVQWIQWMWDKLNQSTIQRRSSAFREFCRFCRSAYGLNISAESFSEHLKTMKLRPKSKNRKTVPMSKVDRIIEHVTSPVTGKADELTLLRKYRDRAFILAIADSGLRVSEACAIKRGDLDIKERFAVITGKGLKKAVIRFSKRSLTAIQSYLAMRGKHDGATGKPLSSLPLFARTTPTKVKPIGPQTGRAIVNDLAIESLGADYVAGEITPHSFRHYFVMVALKNTGGDLKKVKELARHESITTTEIYTQFENDELDQLYRGIFDKDLS